MQTIRVVLTTILLGLFGFAGPFVNCSEPPGAILDISTEDQLNMSNSISTLLLRNLSEVFGENDPVRRRAAIDEIFHEDAVFYDPKGGIFRGRDEIDRIAGEIRTTHRDFRYQPIGEPEVAGNGGRSDGWRAALVRRQLMPGLISSLPAMAGLPPFISSSTSYPELDSRAASLPGDRRIVHRQPGVARNHSVPHEPRGWCVFDIPSGIRDCRTSGVLSRYSCSRKTCP